MNQEILNKLIEKLPKKKNESPYENRHNQQGMWTDIGYNQAIKDCISSLPEVIREYNKWLVEEIEKLEKDLGQELYSKLDFKKIILIIQTAGSVDLGKKIDLDNLITNK